MTFSADGTAHRSINYTSRHVNLQAESYSADGQDGKKTHATRLIGVHSALDGSSEESVKSWKGLLGNIADIYNHSPLGKNADSLLRVVDIFVKLAGMHTDHCAKEKKDARLLEQEKILATYQSLGEDQIVEKSNQELLPYFLDAQKKMIDLAGGRKKWDSLSESEKVERNAVSMEQLTKDLGRDHYEKLSDDGKRILKLFIWAGCGCHKDLNTVRGGNTAMMAWWKENQVEPPVLLANWDNAAVLKEKFQHTDVTTPAQERALQMTTRGGVKATQLAGEILNNKNDKKGHHDSFRWWWMTNVGKSFTFPDTSNNRFQSHCEAAAAILQHLQHFIAFLEYVKEKKQTMRFSHMEENLWKALHCTATKTELAVLALYAQAVTHPYMRSIRTPGNAKINMLELGPLHHKVYEHMQRIIGDPDFLVGNSVTWESGSMDGQMWQAPKTIDAVQQLAPALPHLRPLLVAFFKGASVTWKRFTSEFAPGGLIDEATMEERELAWMPPTNDVNEGALGSFRVLMRCQPHLTALQYNARAMFAHNDTQAFMERKFQPEDHKYIRRLARKNEVRGLEQARKKAIVEHAQARVDKCIGARTARKEKAAKVAHRVAAVKLIFDKEQIKILKGDNLRDHLQAYQKAGAPNVQNMSPREAVARIRAGLHEAIDLYKSGQWKPSTNVDSETSSEELDSVEEFDLEGGQSDWEDVQD